jgi:hypothetical protein
VLVDAEIGERRGHDLKLTTQLVACFRKFMQRHDPLPVQGKQQKHALLRAVKNLKNTTKLIANYPISTSENCLISHLKALAEDAVQTNAHRASRALGWRRYWPLGRR